MRLPTILTPLGRTIRRRPVRSRRSIRDDFYPQFEVRRLEQRRVLTVNVDAGADQTDVDEGDQVELDPATYTFEDVIGALNAGGVQSATIDWGDGISSAGTVDELLQTISGNHTYADNGIYTVTVTAFDDQGGQASDTLQVTVDNVAPTLTVAEDQTVDEGSLLSITDIGMFTDPGFDNPLNVGGELTETFLFSIDWGDGTTESFGAATIDVPGGPGVPTAGSFDGSHIYADNGIYTVTVTVFDDDGGEASNTLLVAVDNVAPTLTVAEDQTVDEGSLLSITDIGMFTDPGFDNPLNVGGELTETFLFSIDWGDGTTPNFGAATIDTPGGPGVPTAGSFDGSHIYADNGIYTVTVTVFDDDGGQASDTLQVTVDNVDPTLAGPSDQVLFQNQLLDLPDIGTFTDPGFDNPLNVGGEVEETFTFSIDWGDGTLPDFGIGTVDTLGGPGILTAGSFDGSHAFAAGGLFTVTVTVFDDDGGSDVVTFEVFVIPVVVPPIGVPFPPGGALASQELPEVIIVPELPQDIPEQFTTSDFRPGRVGSSPVAEKRYVLRVVAPDGQEGEDVPLKDDVLDHLIALFAKLPDDHYRIYLIRVDGTERLVLDFQIRNRRPVDPADPAELPRDLPPKAAPAPVDPLLPPAGQPAETPNQQTKRDEAGVLDESNISIEAPRAPVVERDPRLFDPTRDESSVAFDRHAISVTASVSTAIGAIVYSRFEPWRRRVDRAMQASSPRRFTKAARLCRRIRQTETPNQPS